MHARAARKQCPKCHSVSAKVRGVCRDQRGPDGMPCVSFVGARRNLRKGFYEAGTSARKENPDVVKNWTLQPRLTRRMAFIVESAGYVRVVS